MGPPHYDYGSLLQSELSEGEKSELIRFLLTLELWETTPGEKEMSAATTWIKALCLGPEFAEQLSDQFDSSWRERQIGSYNFLFPSRFLPRWKEATDDLSLCRENTWSDPDVLFEFKTETQKLFSELPNEINFPHDEEILFEKSTTTSYVYSQDRKMPQWEASFLSREFNTKELRGLRTVVPVYPGGTRDTIIADISANNSIRWLERSFRHVLEHVPESAVCLRSTTFQRRLESVVYKRGSHILRDIKKCGITFNVKDLFPIIMEEIINKYHDHRFERMKIFQNMIIIDNDTEYEAQRGYGLGMANHIVTLANIIIHRMCRNAICQRKIPFKMRSVLGNDDADIVIFCKNKDHQRLLAREYLEMEHTIHGALGNLTNFKKSVISPYGLFYENHARPGWKDKESLVCNAIACAYLAPNIRVAKHYVYSQSERFTSIWARRRLRALAQYWGAEFFDVKTELVINFEAGGWLNTRSLGLKTTLNDLDRLTRKFRQVIINIAVETSRAFMNPPRPVYTKPGIVQNFKYFGSAKRADPKVQIYTLSDEDLKLYYRKLTSYQRKYSNRLENFKKRISAKSVPRSNRDNYKLLLKRDPWYTIPECLCDGEYWPDKDLILLKYDAITEITSHSENLVEDLLNDQRAIDDEIFSWDPNIPGEAHAYKIEADIPTMVYASQFSNSGYLPVLEYFLKMGHYPNVREIIGRVRFPGPPTISTKSALLVSNFRHKGRKKDQLSDDGHEDDDQIGAIDPDQEPEKVVEEDVRAALVKATKEVLGVDLLERKRREENLERLSHFFDLNHERVYARTGEIVRTEEQVDIFDDDNDEPFDFSLMG